MKGIFFRKNQDPKYSSSSSLTTRRMRFYRQPLGSYQCAALALATAVAGKRHWSKMRRHLAIVERGVRVHVRGQRCKFSDPEVRMLIANEFATLRNGTNAQTLKLPQGCRDSFAAGTECACTRFCVRCTCDECRVSPSGGLYNKKMLNCVHHHGRYEVTGPQSTIPCETVHCGICAERGSALGPEVIERIAAYRRTHRSSVQPIDGTKRAPPHEARTRGAASAGRAAESASPFAEGGDGSVWSRLSEELRSAVLRVASAARAPTAEVQRTIEWYGVDGASSAGAAAPAPSAGLADAAPFASVLVYAAWRRKRRRGWRRPRTPLRRLPSSEEAASAAAGAAQAQAQLAELEGVPTSSVAHGAPRTASLTNDDGHAREVDAYTSAAVSCLVCTVTFHANHAHNLTRSP